MYSDACYGVNSIKCAVSTCCMSRCIFRYTLLFAGQNQAQFRLQCMIREGYRQVSTASIEINSCCKNLFKFVQICWGESLSESLDYFSFIHNVSCSLYENLYMDSCKNLLGRISARMDSRILTEFLCLAQWTYSILQSGQNIVYCDR